LHEAEGAYDLEVAWENLMDFICSLDVAEGEDNAEFDDRLNMLFDYIVEHCQDIPAWVKRLPERIIATMRTNTLQPFDQEVLRLCQSFDEYAYLCQNYELFASYLNKMDLIELGLWQSELDSSALTEIVNSGALSSIEVLNLSSNDLDYEGLSVLVNSPDVIGLKELTVGFNNLTDDDVAAIAQSKHLVSLEYLNLSSANFSSETFRELCQSDTFQNLTELRLQMTGFNDEMAQSLADSTFAPSLEVLDIGGSSYIGQAGVRLILDGLASLTSLSLVEVDINDDMMREIEDSSPATSLENIYIGEDRQNVYRLCRWANEKNILIYVEGSDYPENNPNS
jgi:hypothetical protein